jgi:hypothetical protein
MLRGAQQNSMSIIAYAVTLFLVLGSAVLGLSGCAGINLKSPPHEVKAFFVAGKEANYLALQCPTSGYMDLSAYSHLMEIKYPRTTQVEVLKKAPSRPYKSFAVLEYEPAPHSRLEEVVEGLKDKAREIGADAIILCQAGPDSGLPGTPPAAIMQAVAIRYIVTTPSDKGNRS